jgi:AcrR family transcriptional regulator
MSRTPDPHAKIALLRAAEEVFATKGLVGAKVEEITRRAGTSKGAFYLHFESKDVAFREVVESFLARCHAVMQPPSDYPALPGGAPEMLEFCLARDVEMFDFLWQNRAILRILGGCQGPHVYLMETFRAGIATSCQAWVDVWKERGLYRREVDREVVATLLCGGYHELVHKMLASVERPPIGEWLREAQGAFVRGLGTPTLIEAVVADADALERADREPRRTRRRA